MAQEHVTTEHSRFRVPSFLVAVGILIAVTFFHIIGEGERMGNAIQTAIITSPSRLPSSSSLSSAKVSNTTTRVDATEKTTAAIPFSLANQTKQRNQIKALRSKWDRWFQPIRLGYNDSYPLSLWNYTNAHPSNQSKIVELAKQQQQLTHDVSFPTTYYTILYYHVMKTGGSTIYKMFLDYNKRYDMPIDWKLAWGSETGPEVPGKLNQFVSWRKEETIVSPSNPSMNTTISSTSGNSDTSNIHNNKLLVISFREPVERTISHYFQVKPCPNGRGGGADQACRKKAQIGLNSFLLGCKFARNWQSRYIDNSLKQLQEFDFILLNDRMDESLILMSIKYKIPILDLMYVKKKVRVDSSAYQISSEGNLHQNYTKQQQNQQVASCTAQWMTQLIPAENLANLNCSKGCVGAMGKLATSEEEIQLIERLNEMDLRLWNDHAVPRYNAEKSRLLKAHGVTQRELDTLVDQYDQVRDHFERHYLKQQQ